MSNDILVVGIGLSALLLLNYDSVSSYFEQTSAASAAAGTSTAKPPPSSGSSAPSSGTSRPPGTSTTKPAVAVPPALNATWDTLLGVQPMLKDVALDLVLAKAASALLNESGLRLGVATSREAAALKKKEQLAGDKLITLQEKKAKLEKLKSESKTFLTSAAEKRQRISEIRALKDKVNTEKAQLKAIADTRSAALAAEKVKSDAAKAKIVAQGNKVLARQSAGTIKNKAALGTFAQRVQNNMAKRLNHARKAFGKHMASIKIPKFTMRGAVHGGASSFGIMVMAYDLVRMFNPDFEPWAKKGHPAPVVEVPAEVYEPEERFVYPLCADIEKEVDGKTIKLCRERRPMPWEELSYNGLRYYSPCPPNYSMYTWAGYARCATDSEYITSGEYITKDVPPSRANFKSGDRFTRQHKITMEEGTNYWCGGTNFDSYGGGRCGSGDHMEAAIPLFADALPQEFYDSIGLTKFLNENPGKTGNELQDPDYIYKQYQNQDSWGRYEGERVRLQKNKHQFGTPYREVQVGVRGGWDLSVEERIRQLMPDASEVEIQSAIDAANDSDIAGDSFDGGSARMIMP